MLAYREKVRVYINVNNRYYGLFNVIQMGKNGDIDLKITDSYNKAVTLSNVEGQEKGYMTETELEKSVLISKMEMSYHKDGSCLYKIKDKKYHIYQNPYGEGERWIATNAIEDVQPIISINLRRIASCKCMMFIASKQDEYIHICKNDKLFDIDGGYIVILYIRNKQCPINYRHTNMLYSDVLIGLNDILDLCIFIHRHHYSKPTPYYSKDFGGFITPYLYNSIGFCDRDLSIKQILLNL